MTMSLWGAAPDGQRSPAQGAPRTSVVEVMPGRAKPTSFLKRQREQYRQQKQKEKAERRREAKARKAANVRAEGETRTPILPGIRPGPQPLPEQWNVVEEEEGLSLPDFSASAASRR